MRIPDLDVPDVWSIARVQLAARSQQNSQGPASGLGDLTFPDFAVYRAGPFNLAAGFATIFPMATTPALGQGKWQVGPAVGFSIPQNSCAEDRGARSELLLRGRRQPEPDPRVRDRSAVRHAPLARRSVFLHRRGDELLLARGKLRPGQPRLRPRFQRALRRGSPVLVHRGRQRPGRHQSAGGPRFSALESAAPLTR